MADPRKTVQLLTQLNRIIQNHAVGNEVIVLNALFLIFWSRIGNFAFSPEQEPFAESIELFHFIGSGLNHLTELLIRKKLEEEDRAYHAAQLSKRLVETILAAIVGKLT